VRDLSHQILVLKNTVDLLIAGQNGHAAMLEIHQLRMQRQFEVQDYSPTPDGIPADPDPTPDCVFSPHPPIPPEGMNKWQQDMVFNMASIPRQPMATTGLIHQGQIFQTKQNHLGSFSRISSG